MRVPRGFVARMRHGDANDPLLLQVLPRAAELGEVPGFTRDAVGDLDALKRPRRAAQVPRPRAPDRDRLVRGQLPLLFPPALSLRRGDGRREWLARRDRRAARRCIDRGSDPVGRRSAVAVDGQARRTHRRAGQRLPHIRRLRIHTRLPVVLPERVDAEFIGWLGGAAVRARRRPACQSRRTSSTPRSPTPARASPTPARPLLNQSVLLRWDQRRCGRARRALSERLFECGVLPYYLHQLDRVAGAAHFEVGRRARAGSSRRAAARLPGYLVPRLVREVAGRRSEDAAVKWIRPDGSACAESGK